jgi:hypothetical protein
MKNGCVHNGVGVFFQKEPPLRNLDPLEQDNDPTQASWPTPFATVPIVPIPYIPTYISTSLKRPFSLFLGPDVVAQDCIAHGIVALAPPLPSIVVVEFLLGKLGAMEVVVVVMWGGGGTSPNI